MTLSVSGRTRRWLAERLWPVPPAAPRLELVDGLLTVHNSDFMDDPDFVRAYRAGQATGSWNDHELPWRAYVVAWAARRGCTIEGDFVECGVNRGGYSRLLAEYVGLADLPSKRLHLVDTFAGIPERFVDDTIRTWLPDAYEDCYDDVVRTFAPFPNVEIVRGEVPDVLGSVRAERVCYLSVDLNTVEPSIAATEHFWPRMSSGAAMVLDDYGFAAFRDQKVAFDDFASTVGLEVLTLPTGQGLLFKP